MKKFKSINYLACDVLWVQRNNVIFKNGVPDVPIVSFFTLRVCYGLGSGIREGPCSSGILLANWSSNPLECLLQSG